MMSITIEEVKKLLKERNEQYDLASKELLVKLSGITEGVAMYVEGEGMLDANTKLEFISIGFDDETSILSLTGTITPDIGTTIQNSLGENMLIADEYDQNQNSKFVRMSVPEEIMVANDADTTLDYIVRMNDRLAEVTKELRETEETHMEAVHKEGLPPFTEEQKKDQELLEKILRGAQNPSGLFN